jgi:hypothetical protein
MLFIKATDFPKRRRRVAAKRRPILSTYVIALLAGGIAFGTALVVPILWAAVRHSPLAYEQCEAVKEDASRLACYDRVIRQNSLHPAKEVRRRLPSGEIQNEQP